MAPSWAYHPFKRLFLPEDEFFEEGNIFCNLLRKQINYREEEDFDEWSSVEFKCSVPGCNEYFVNIKRFEIHYRSSHWNSCRYCRKSFQTSFLLDIHILENHDTLFQMIARKQFMYRCLVENCPDKFGTEEDRKKHLVETHKYPTNFRFNKPSRTQKKQKRQSVDNETSSPQDTTNTPMDTESNTTNKNPKPSKYRAPKNICFGRGSARGFHMSTRGKPKGKKKHQGSSQQVAMDTIS